MRHYFVRKINSFQLQTTNSQLVIHILVVALMVMAASAFVFGDNSLLQANILNGEVLHSNYVLPHAGADHSWVAEVARFLIQFMRKLVFFS